MNESVSGKAAGPRGLRVSKAWVQAVAIVLLFGFFVLGFLAYRTYTGAAPMPERVVGPDGQVLFSGADIRTGQEVFLRNGLMEYGSIFGHGAYLGPDYTADYLRRAALIVQEENGGAAAGEAKARTVAEFKTNRYDAATVRASK
jgi:nitric oxide reductase subunit B